MKVAYGGKVHDALEPAPGTARIICNAVALNRFSYEALTRNDTKLTCRACKAAQRRAAKEREG